MNDHSVEEIGRNWIVAIITLMVLLTVGVLLYFRMSAPLVEQPRRPAAERVPKSIQSGSAFCGDMGIVLMSGLRV